MLPPPCCTVRCSRRRKASSNGDRWAAWQHAGVHTMVRQPRGVPLWGHHSGMPMSVSCLWAAPLLCCREGVAATLVRPAQPLHLQLPMYGPAVQGRGGGGRARPGPGRPWAGVGQHGAGAYRLQPCFWWSGASEPKKQQREARPDCRLLSGGSLAGGSQLAAKTSRAACIIRGSTGGAGSGPQRGRHGARPC